jgi:hypothetical protein
MSLDTIQQDRSQASATGVPADQISTGADLEELEARFRPIFARIHETARERDRERRLPRTEIDELRRAGFGALRVPKVFGGAGASITQLTGLLTELSAADPNVNQALRGHLAFVEDRLWQHRDTDQSRWFHRFVAGDLVGNAWTEVGDVRVGEVQTRVTRQSDGDYLASGRKYYTTGSIFADWIDLYAQRAEDGVPVIAAVSTHQDGSSSRTTGTASASARRVVGRRSCRMRGWRRRRSPSSRNAFPTRPPSTSSRTWPPRWASPGVRSTSSSNSCASGCACTVTGRVLDGTRIRSCCSRSASPTPRRSRPARQRSGSARPCSSSTWPTAVVTGHGSASSWTPVSSTRSRGQSVNTKRSRRHYPHLQRARRLRGLGGSGPRPALAQRPHSLLTQPRHLQGARDRRLAGHGTPLPYAWAIGRERDEQGARA